MNQVEAPQLSLGSGVTVAPEATNHGLGSTLPRNYTKPLIQGPAGPCGCGCSLTPETSYGFAVVEFAEEVLEQGLLPWQRWLVIHLGELLPDGRPRFRRALVLVARQNGKTHVLKVLANFWLFVERWPLLAGTSTNLKMAKEAWQFTYDMAKASDVLAPEIAIYRRDNNDPHFKTVDGSRYMVAASNDDSLRGFSVDRLIMDELRQHHNYSAYNAGYNTMKRRSKAQMVAISNAGEDASEVLNDLQDSALTFIRKGTGDRRLGLFEWSAADDADLLAPDTWAQANPAMNYVVAGDYLNSEDIHGEITAAIETGGAQLNGIKTEVLCQRVRALDPAFDAVKWAESVLEGSLNDDPRRVTIGFDVSPGGRHATLVGAVKKDGRVFLQPLKQWDGKAALENVVADIENLLSGKKPARFVYSAGPADSYGAQLRTLKVPASVQVEELTSDIYEACMGFARAVESGQVAHNDDSLLNDHITGAAKHGDDVRFKYSRKGEPCDAAYAAALAWFAVETLPARPGPFRLVGPDDDEED